MLDQAAVAMTMPRPHATVALACRGCGGTGLRHVLSLGTTPLANALLRADQLDKPEPAFPLDLVFCPRCALLQLEHSVPPEQMFRDYVYFSSFSDTMVRHAGDLAREMRDALGLNADSLVVEAASNDGYLLQHYRQAGVGVLGIEPAVNVAEVARSQRGIPTLCEFFTRDLAVRLRGEGKAADLFHAHNVLAHVPDLPGFLAGIRELLKPTGVAVIEVPYVKDFLDACEFDTVYHEHLSYFSLLALDHAFCASGLTIHDVRRVAIHGGTLRLYASPSATARPVTPAVARLLADERAWGLDSLAPYDAFAHRVYTLKTELLALLATLKNQDKRIAAYGASAKGSTLLNFCAIGHGTLDFVADRSTVKQGRFTPGTHLPIVAPDALLQQQPDYCLLLTWNFADEILQQQAEYRRRGGKFIIPVPTVRVAE